MYSHVMTASVAKTVGENARKIRRGHSFTLDRMAFAMRVYGLPWTSGRWGDLEAGRVVLTPETLFVVALALSATTERPVTLVDLLAGTGSVAISDELTVSRKRLRAFYSGGPATSAAKVSPRLWAQLLTDAGPSRHRELLDDFREADTRLCKRIGVGVETGADLMGELWGRVFTAERGRRAPAGANAQKLGQITRALQNELREKMAADGVAADGVR